MNNSTDSVADPVNDELGNNLNRNGDDKYIIADRSLPIR